jgi:outer membrane protein TolC
MSFRFLSLVADARIVHAVLVAALLPLPAFGQALLTLDEALRIAESRAPAVSASVAAARGAREMAVAASQLPDPVLRAGIDNLPITGGDAFSLTRDFMTMGRIGVMQEYVSQAKREARRDREERDARRLEAEGDLSLTEVRTEVAAAWYDRLYARRAEQLFASLVEELRMQPRAMEAQVGSGKTTAADVLAARALEVQTRDRILALQRQQQAATGRLFRWVGEDARRVASDDADRPTDAAVAALTAYDLQDIASVRVLASQVAVAEADVVVARENRNPNWSWELAYQQRGSAYSYMISLGVSVPLPIDRADRQDRELAARLAQRDQARERLEDARRRYRADFDAMRVDWLALRDRQRELEQSLLPLARQRVDAQLAAYRGGQQPLSAVLDARRAEVDARVAILDLEREAARLWAQLQFTYLQAPADRQSAVGTKP